MSALERAKERVKSRNLRVVMPEREDARIAAAVDRLHHENLCEVVPLAGDGEGYVQALVQARGVKAGIARRMLTRPMYRAAAMVAAGEADAMVAGAVAPTC